VGLDLRRPMLVSMAKNLQMLEVRLMPGERVEYAMPFESLQVLTPLWNLEVLSVELVGAGPNLLDPFCSLPNLRVLEVRAFARQFRYVCIWSNCGTNMNDLIRADSKP
jgi:hypothetical protein